MCVCFSLSMLSVASLAVADMGGNYTTLVKSVKNPQLGEILTDSKGMTLYVFTEDKQDESHCYGQCSILWPPFLLNEQSLKENLKKPIGVITRSDNSLQLTFKNKPLYYYVKDKKPGDSYGQNVDQKWFVVKLNEINE